MYADCCVSYDARKVEFFCTTTGGGIKLSCFVDGGTDSGCDTVVTSLLKHRKDSCN